MKNDSNNIYVFLDGDGIGDKLELLLLDGKIEDAKRFSNSINTSINRICTEIMSTKGVQLLFSGGDDVVFYYQGENWNIDSIYKFQKQFEESTGNTLSAGIGISIQSAITNLRRAKLSGKNKIVFQ